MFVYFFYFDQKHFFRKQFLLKKEGGRLEAIQSIGEETGHAPEQKCHIE